MAGTYWYNYFTVPTLVLVLVLCRNGLVSVVLSCFYGFWYHASKYKFSVVSKHLDTWTLYHTPWHFKIVNQWYHHCYVIVCWHPYLGALKSNITLAKVLWVLGDYKVINPMQHSSCTFNKCMSACQIFWKFLYPMLLDAWMVDTHVTCPGKIGG